MLSCMWPTRMISLLMSLANITLCVGWFLVRFLIWSLIIGMSVRLVGCENMCMFIMSSCVSGLLYNLKTSRYIDMFLGTGILIVFSAEYIFSSIMARTPPLGGLDVVNCGFLCRFVSIA